MVPVPKVSHSTVPATALCSALVTELEVSAASISVFGQRGRQSAVCVSGELAARADALQFELGEGPRWQALESRTPVLCRDLDSGVPDQWPVFHEAVRALGVRSLFAFPMVMGAAMVGIADLYCTSHHPAGRDFVSRASLLAARLASAAVQRALHSAEDHQSAETPLAPALRREVHQATGMIVSQLNMGVTEAFSRLQAHAFTTGRSIDAIAHDVVERVLAFNDLPD